MEGERATKAAKNPLPAYQPRNQQLGRKETQENSAARINRGLC
jgi:hypothetical protein